MKALRDDRFIAVVVGGLVSYALIEGAIGYLRDRREKFVMWREKFVEPFLTHPGRREWLSETLTREEMNVTPKHIVDAATGNVSEDCGCTDA